MLKGSKLALWVFLAFLTSVPVFVFSFLKYNGLTDNFGAETSTGESVVDSDPTSCKLSVKFLGSETTLENSGENAICGAIDCQSSRCAAIIENAGNKFESASDKLALEALRASMEKEKDPEEVVPEEPGSGVNQVDENSNESGVAKFVATANENRYGYAVWQWLSIFSVAITFALVGFLSSVFLNSQTGNRKIFDTKFSFAIVYSMVCGIIVVSLFAGGFLQGNLFPNFTGDELNFGFNSWSALKFRGQDWFKLGIWGYISGFYERFIPDNFDKILKRSEESENSDTNLNPSAK
jgi:hypothetical protein